MAELVEAYVAEVLAARVDSLLAFPPGDPDPMTAAVGELGRRRCNWLVDTILKAACVLETAEALVLFAQSLEGLGPGAETRKAAAAGASGALVREAILRDLRQLEASRG
jgi:hypothetical protein